MHINNLYRHLDPVYSAQAVATSKSESSVRNGRGERSELRALTGADKRLLAAIYGEDTETSAVTPLAALWLNEQRRTELFDRPVDAELIMDMRRRAQRRSEDVMEEIDTFARSALVYLDANGSDLDDEARALRLQGGFSLYC